MPIATCLLYTSLHLKITTVDWSAQGWGYGHFAKSGDRRVIPLASQIYRRQAIANLQ
jgi:hypothetical protein